jgi:hypothetical protein
MTQSLSRILVLTALAVSAAACTFNEAPKPTPVVVNPAPAAPSGTVVVTPSQ